MATSTEAKGQESIEAEASAQKPRPVDAMKSGFSSMWSAVKKEAINFWPPYFYKRSVKAMSGKIQARIEGDLAEVWVLRSDMNSVSVANVRHSAVLERFPDADPTMVWRTGSSEQERIMIFVGTLFMAPGLLIYSLVLPGAVSLPIGLLCGLVWMIWMSYPVYQFAKAWAAPRHLWVIRVTEREMTEEERTRNEIRLKEGKPIERFLDVYPSAFQDEYIERGYSTEFASMTMEQEVLREFSKHDWEADSFLSKIPMTLVIAFGIACLLIFMLHESNKQDSTDEGLVQYQSEAAANATPSPVHEIKQQVGR